MGRLFHNTVGKLISNSKEIFFNRPLKTLPGGIYQVTPEPIYISQFAASNLSKINGFYQPIEDKAAATRFGAKDLQEFSYWAWRACGIVAVQMVLKTELGKDFKKNTMDLINEALDLNGYEFENDTGWKHQVLAKLAQSYGIKSWTQKFVPVSQITGHILNNNYILVSIKSKNGGHLLLVYGLQFKDGKIQNFIVHDPSDFKKVGKSRKISVTEFERLSTRRVIVFENRKNGVVKP